MQRKILNIIFANKFMVLNFILSWLNSATFARLCYLVGELNFT